MVVHEECAFRPLETLDFPSPLVELLDTYFPASLQPSTLQLLGWKVAESAAVSRFHRSRSHRRRPGLSTSSRRDVSIIVAKRGATTSFGYRTIFFVSRCTIGSPLRFNLTLNSGKLGRICIRFAARPKRDEVRRRDLVKGDFTIISPLSLEDSAAENRTDISRTRRGCTASLVPSGCRVFLTPFSSSLRARQTLRARKGVASSSKTAQICSVHCPFASNFLRTRIESKLARHPLTRFN